MSASTLMVQLTGLLSPAADRSPRHTRTLHSNSHAAAEDDPALDALIAQVRQLPAGLATTAAAAEQRAPLDEDLLPLQLKVQHHLAALQAGAQAVNLQSLPSDSQQLSIGSASAARVFGSRQAEVGSIAAAFTGNACCRATQVLCLSTQTCGLLRICMYHSDV
jgi:hypothetical protein